MTLSHDEGFLLLVRQHLDHVLLDAGFGLNEVTVGVRPGTAPLARESRTGAAVSTAARRNASRASARAIATTSVLYEADAHDFTAAYPRSKERPEKPDCKDLWLHYDGATGSVDIDLKGEDLDLRDSAGVVNDHSRSLEERVLGVTGAVERFLAQPSATH
jgi:hypothetical protein